MADEQKKYPYATKKFLKKFAETIAERVNQLFFKTSDAVTAISSESTDNEIPTAKAVNNVANDLKNQISKIDPDLFFKKMSTIVGNETDWDEILDTGCYMVSISSSVWGESSEIYHTPATYGKIYSYGLLLVFKSYSDWRITQIYIPHTSTTVFSSMTVVRVKEGSNWTKWRSICENNDETTIITLINNTEYPFNNSQQSVSIKNIRSSTNYDIDTEIITPADGSQVGRIVITDKLTNGFKIAYTGSAKSVQIKCTVKGGMS